ncbi:MAG: hypothetical protein CMB46_01630 [Euryarchaeota archaeon]|nr:hypothetical protein [Euryarchaeota archaeon]
MGSMGGIAYRDLLRNLTITRAAYTLLLAVFLWSYTNKFLGMNADYIEAMSRDLTLNDTQMNPSFMELSTLIMVIGGVQLILFLLVQNEFSKAFNEPTDVKAYSTSLFAITMFLLAFLAVPALDLSPGTQMPFLFLGAGVVSGILLLQNNLAQILDPEAWRNKEVDMVGAVISVGAIVIFLGLTMNLSMVPILAQNSIALLSAAIVVAVVAWSSILSSESAKPSIQAHRTTALALLGLFPIITYFVLRVMYLQHHPDPVMTNRWLVDLDFMELGNTFRINSWPFEVEPTLDSRWLFYKAAIINSARATLLSIVLCTILGIIVGVTRLSSNKLASTMATVYVEVFRNLPLAVLLFLVATQMGHQLPRFHDEANLFDGAIYYSNQGIWFTTVASYQALFAAIVGLALLRTAMRFRERVEPRSPESAFTPLGRIRRPFSPLGWKLEPVVCELFVIVSGIYFVYVLHPFVSTLGGGTEAGLGLLLLVYSLYVFTCMDDDGMNILEIDDSEEGLRMKFTIWVSAFAIAAGLVLSQGLSKPEYIKPNLIARGTWDIAEGTGFEITPAFAALIIGLTLFTASTVAEIVRGSIQSLPRGQVEAAISLSLSPFQRLRLVILPQALRSMVPLLNNQYMNVWKNSSLAVVVAYSDIFYVVVIMMNNVGKLIPLFLLLLVTYQAGSLMISAVMNWYNARVTSVKI